MRACADGDEACRSAAASSGAKVLRPDMHEKELAAALSRFQGSKMLKIEGDITALFLFYKERTAKDKFERRMKVGASGTPGSAGFGGSAPVPLLRRSSQRSGAVSARRGKAGRATSGTIRSTTWPRARTDMEGCLTSNGIPC